MLQKRVDGLANQMAERQVSPNSGRRGIDIRQQCAYRGENDHEAQGCRIVGRRVMQQVGSKPSRQPNDLVGLSSHNGKLMKAKVPTDHRYVIGYLFDHTDKVLQFGRRLGNRRSLGRRRLI